MMSQLRCESGSGSGGGGVTSRRVCFGTAIWTGRGTAVWENHSATAELIN